MAPSVVSPLCARVSAALAIARMLLFTLFKILLVPVVRSVLDACSAAAIADIAYPFWILAVDTASLVLSTIIQLVYALFDIYSPNLFRLMSATEPHVSAIHHCAMERGIINCGSTLVHDILWATWLGYTSLIDILSASFFSFSFWDKLAFRSAVAMGLILLLVYRNVHESPLTEDETRLFIDVYDALTEAYDSFFAFFRWLRKHAATMSLVPHVYLCYMTWMAEQRDPFLEYSARSSLCPGGLDLSLRCSSITKRMQLEQFLRSIIASPLAWYLPLTVLYAVTLGAMAFSCLMCYVLLRAYVMRKVCALRVAALAQKRPLAGATVDSVAPQDVRPTIPAVEEAVATVQQIPPASPGGATDEEEGVADDAAVPLPACEFSVTPPRSTQCVTQAITLSKRFKPCYNIHPELIAKYDLHDALELGAGANGFVLQARRLSDGQPVAVKVVVANEEFREHPVYGRVPDDVIVMDGLDHENIVKMLDVFTDDDYVYIVQEMHGDIWWPQNEADAAEFPNGSRCLEACMLQNGALYLKDVKRIISQLVDALHYLHMKGIAHCDIKPANILIDGEGNIKLIDFGNASVAPDDWDWEDGPPVYLPDGPGWILGTPIWSPPELHLGDPYMLEPVDVWAIGALYFFLLTGIIPFLEVERIKEGLIMCDPEWLHDDGELVKAWPVIQACLRLDLRKRPSLEELKTFLWEEKVWDLPDDWCFPGMGESYYVYQREGDVEFGLD